MSEGASDGVLLVVDDDRDIRETIQTILELYGYRVVTAGVAPRRSPFCAAAR